MATSRGTEATSVPGVALLDGRPERGPESAAGPDTAAVPVTAARRSYWRTNGWRNGSELWAVTHLEPLWTLLRRLPVVRSRTNRLLINRLVYKFDTRPNVLSTKTPYTSWESLTDRTYSARHLPADDALERRLQQVAPASVAELFRREQPRVSAKS